MHNFIDEEGGAYKYDIRNTRGVPGNMTNTDQGREGVKNPENLADIICAWPLTLVHGWLTVQRGDSPRAQTLGSGP